MISHTDITYEGSINPLLRCPTCSKPYIDPVINNNNNQTRTCRLCASSTDVRPVVEDVLHQMLNNLRVTCNKCNATDLRRGDYPDHIQNHCPQRIVTCIAADLRCPWTGPSAQLHQHIQTCSVEALRPTLAEIFARINENQTRNETQPEEWARAYEEVQHEAEQLRNERRELQGAIVQISNQLDQLTVPQNVDSTNRIVELTQALDEQLKRNESLEMEIQELKQLNDKQVTLYNELQKKFEQYQQSNNSDTEIQNLKRLFVKQLTLHNELRAEFERFKQSINTNSDTQQLKEQYDQLHASIQQLSLPPTTSDLHDDNEIESLRQLLHQHDVQIKLLSRKKCVIAVNALTSDPQLEATIDHFMNNDEINLDGKQIADHNIDVICKKAIIGKRCSKLRLNNNKISGKGATTLANSLANNSNLFELYLSKNQISDTGVHALAQTLAVNNCTLKVLDLYSNNITDEGMEYLSEMLKVNRTIIRLGLGHNQISDQGFEMFIQTMIHSNSTLQWLSLSTNRLITDKSLPGLKTMLTSSCSLKTLWLNGCNFSDKVIQELKEHVKTLDNFNLEIEKH